VGLEADYCPPSRPGPPNPRAPRHKKNSIIRKLQFILEVLKKSKNQLPKAKEYGHFKKH
jgi:hypothetical protein